jgi:hypothetical protein
MICPIFPIKRKELLIMAKRYQTIKRYLTREEKEARVKAYNEDANYYGYDPVDPVKFINSDIADEYLIMKCIRCKVEEKTEADIVEEMFEFSGEEYPKLYCPKCNKGTMVPLDIYNQDFNK